VTRLRRAVVSLVLLVGGCGPSSTSLLVTIVAAPGTPAPDSVRVRVFDEGGALYGFTSFAAPAPGADGSLGTVLVYAEPDQGLRVQAQGLKSQALVTEGVVLSRVTAGKQVAVSLTLGPQRPADRDGDGVPDLLDNCPEVSNDDQLDSDRDGTGDRCTQDAADAGVADGPPAADGPSAPDAAAAVDAATAPVRDAGVDVCRGPGCGSGPLGATCAAGTDCASGHCTDGVCCGSADCGGPCRSCDQPASRGTCHDLPAGEAAPGDGCSMEPASSCGRNGKCDGRGRCQTYPAGTECAAPTCRRAREIDVSTCDDDGSCVPGASHACPGRFGCRGDACAASCALASECNEESYCVKGDCSARLSAGSACTSHDQCGTDFCADGHCCLSPSCAQGAYCGGPGGICLNKIFTGSTEPCTADYMCQSGHCQGGRCQ
jgi:hypothetical protein